MASVSPNPSSSFASSSSDDLGAFESYSRIHRCRWNWCRETFSSNAMLNSHVIYDHVRTAPPVRRKDLGMLRRTEEGEGESLNMAFSAAADTSATDTSLPLASTIPSQQIERNPSPRPSKRVRTESPASSPSHASSLPAEIQLLESLPKPHELEPIQATPPSPPTTPPVPHPSDPAPISSPEEPSADASLQSQSHTHPRPTSPIRPRTPPSSTHMLRRRTFAQISSSLDVTPLVASTASPPMSPSLEVQIADALNGRKTLGARKRMGLLGERLRRAAGWDAPSGLRNSTDGSEEDDDGATPRKKRHLLAAMRADEQEQVGSQGSSSDSLASQTRVERELTQELDSDAGAMEVDVAQAEAEVRPSSRINQEPGSGSDPSTSQSQSGDFTHSMPPSVEHAHGQARSGYMDLDLDTDAELEYPEEDIEEETDADVPVQHIVQPTRGRRYALRSRSRSVSQADDHSQSQPQSRSLKKPVSTPRRDTDSQAPQNSLQNSSLPFILQTQAQGGTWGESSSSSSSLEYVQLPAQKPEPAATATPMRTRRSRTPAVHRTNDEDDPDKTPNQNRRITRPRSSFRSGLLTVGEATRVTRRGTTPKAVPPPTPGRSTRARTRGGTRSQSQSVEPDATAEILNLGSEAKALMSQVITGSQSLRSDLQSQPESQDWEGSYVQPSYLLLQTQAPYQSQSQSSDSSD